jgi:hypothetical protein
MKAEHLLMALAVLVLAAAHLAGQDKRSPTRQQAAQVQTAAFGTMAPSRNGAPVAVTLSYTLHIPSPARPGGYRVNAAGSCTFTSAGSAAGGRSLSDADIGIGVATTTQVPGITIDLGFNYDPGAVRSHNGHSKYAGLSGGQATMADLQSGREVIRGDRTPPGNQLSIEIRAAMIPQFVTPGSFSCQIVLTVE